jgi:acyl-CoA synthetase (AMP-forming)/AMP-acid ligase II
MVDELPRNSSGKLLKHKLVAMYGRIPRSKI